MLNDDFQSCSSWKHYLARVYEGPYQFWKHNERAKLAPSGPSSPVKWLQTRVQLWSPAEWSLDLMSLKSWLTVRFQSCTLFNRWQQTSWAESKPIWIWGKVWKMTHHRAIFSVAAGVCVPVHVIYWLMAADAGGFRPCHLFLFGLQECHDFWGCCFHHSLVVF